MARRPLSKAQKPAEERPSMEATLDGEEWRPLGDAHLISSAGRVWSVKYQRLLKCARNREGYRTAGIGGKTQYVHALVLEAFVGPRPEGCVARHLNDAPGDDRLENLAWGSRSENSADALRNGRQLGQPGSQNVRAILTEEKVKSLREKRKEGATYVELGRIFRIAPTTARNAAVGDKWKHVA